MSSVSIPTVAVTEAYWQSVIHAHMRAPACILYNISF